MRHIVPLLLVCLFVPILVSMLSLVTVFISALISSDSQSNYWPQILSSSFENSKKVSDCTLYSQEKYQGLGAWLRLNCSEGIFEGPLDGVAGDTTVITNAIQSFVGFHGGELDCEQLSSGVLRCASGKASLNAHLVQHGLMPEKVINSETETWVATLFGFCGAIAAFIYNRRVSNQEDKKSRRLFRNNIELHRDMITFQLVTTFTLKDDTGANAEKIKKAKADLAERIAEARNEIIKNSAIPYSLDAQTKLRQSLETAGCAPEGEFGQIRSSLHAAFNNVLKEIDDND